MGRKKALKTPKTPRPQRGTQRLTESEEPGDGGRPPNVDIGDGPAMTPLMIAAPPAPVRHHDDLHHGLPAPNQLINNPFIQQQAAAAAAAALPPTPSSLVQEF